MKYKVGDLVKIKTWEKMKKEYGTKEYGPNGDGNIDCDRCFLKDMEEALKKNAPDRIVKILRVDDDHYKVENFSWNWSDDMIEELVEPEIFESITNRFELLDIR